MVLFLFFSDWIGMATAFSESECQPSMRHRGRFKNPWPDCKFPDIKDLTKFGLFETNYSKVPSRKEVFAIWSDSFPNTASESFTWFMQVLLSNLFLCLFFLSLCVLIKKELCQLILSWFVLVFRSIFVKTVG